MPWLVYILAFVGFGLGIGLKWLGFIPKLFTTLVAILATIIIGILFWKALGLPAVDLLDMLAGTAWVISLSLAYIFGNLIGSLRD